MDIQQSAVDKDVQSGVVRNRGTRKARTSIAKDAISRGPPDRSNGGSWVIVADAVNVEVNFNF